MKTHSRLASANPSFKQEIQCLQVLPFGIRGAFLTGLIQSRLVLSQPSPTPSEVSDKELIRTCFGTHYRYKKESSMSRKIDHKIWEGPPKTLGRQQGKKGSTDSLRAITEATFIKLTKLKTAGSLPKYAPLKWLGSEKQINFGPVPLIAPCNIASRQKNGKTTLRKESMVTSRRYHAS